MWVQGEYLISTDRALLDIDIIHGYISLESYWGAGRSRELMETAMANSVCFGLYLSDGDGAGPGRKQVGFARVVTDGAVFGYLADVFVLAPYRGKGLGKWLIRTIVEHHTAAGVRKLMLMTRTPDFYLDAGFSISDQDRVSKLMELVCEA